MSELSKKPKLAEVVFTIVPPIFESETILSHVMRMSMMSGGAGIKPLARKLFGVSTLQPPLLIPSNLSLYTRRTAPVFSDPDEAIRLHTLYPLIEPYLAPQARSIVTTHLRFGSTAKSVFTSLGFANKSATGRAVMSMCPICVVADELRYGVAYWHREHQLPGVRTCGYHSVPLVAGCQTCEYCATSSRAARLPRSTCWCGKPHIKINDFFSDVEREADARISKMVLEALRAPLPCNLLPSEWCQLYNSRARALGYARGQHLATPAIEADFLKLFGPELLTQYGAYGRQGCLWLRRAVTMVASTSSCLKHLLLADFLFGSWVEYCNAAVGFSKKNVPVVMLATAVRGELPKQVLAIRIASHRTEIRGFLFENPSATRSQARLGCGTAFNFLYKFDQDWLNENLPRRRNSSFRGLQSSTQYLTSLENELLEEAIKTYALLTRADTRPRRITRRALLADAPRGQEAASGNFKLPKLEAYLLESIESKLQYQLRRAKWILNNPLSVPETSTPLRFASHSTGLSQERILLELFTMESVVRRK